MKLLKPALALLVLAGVSGCGNGVLRQGEEYLAYNEKLFSVFAPPLAAIAGTKPPTSAWWTEAH